MATHQDRDELLRAAAFNAVRALTAVRGELASADLKAGFELDGERIPLVNPQRGIFKPQQMRHLLSIRTVYPAPGRRRWCGPDETRLCLARHGHDDRTRMPRKPMLVQINPLPRP